MKPKVTVLVAVYNAQAFLAESLGSLQRQTMGDFQAVCIDDGSADDSLAVLNDFAARDARFEVIHLTENQGQAHARNVGLEQARGAVVCMLDADDWLSDDALERLCDVFDNNDAVDSVLFNVVTVSDNGDLGERYPMPTFEKLSGEEAFRLSLTWQIHGLYGVRAAIHRQHPYDETCRAYSDDNTTRLHYLASRTVRRCTGVYYYRQHGESMTNRVSALRLDLVEANTSMAHQLLETGQSREVLALFERERWINLTGVIGIWLRNREIQDKTEALERFRRAWKDINKSLLPAGLKMKLGYIPFHSFRLYFLQVQFYFLLRRLLGK